MPPKPLAEDLARKKAERDKQRKAEEALAVLEKPSGFEQAVAAIKDPVGTVKQLGREAKKTFYDPINRAQKAVNPFEDLTPMQRAAGIAEGALVAADFLTPGVPEGAIARGLQREAMEKALDREVASYAASGRNTINHRTVLGVHGSPTEGLTRILPKTDDTTMALDPQAWFWNANESNFNARKIADQVQPYAGPDGEVYFARFPKKDTEYGWTVPDAKGNATAVAAYSTKPGRVVESTPGFFTKDRSLAEMMSYYKADTFTDPNYLRDFVGAFQNSMTPAERRAFIEKQPEIVKMFAELKAGARPRPPISPRQRYTEEELYALRPRPTLSQMGDVTIIPVDAMVDAPVQPPPFTPSQQLLATKNLSDDERAASFLYRSGTAPADIKANVAREAENMDQLMAESRKRLIQAMAERIVRKRRGYGVTPSNEIFPQP